MTRELNTCLDGITVPDFDGDLTVAIPGDDVLTFPMRTPGWCVVDLLGLWQEADVVTDLVDLANIDGQLAQALHRVGTRFDLDFLVTGAQGPLVDEDDDSIDYSTFVKYANPWVGLETNLALLQANVLSPTLLGDGTRPFTLTMPSTDTRTADVHVQPRLDLKDKLRWVRLFTLTLGIPKGRFA